MCESVKMRFALRLKELREKRGLSQAALARQLSLSQSTVGGWETCKREPTFETLELVSDYFGVTTDYILGKTDIPLAVYRQDTPFEEVSRFEKTILNAYRELSEAEQTVICRSLGLIHPAEARVKANRA